MHPKFYVLQQLKKVKINISMKYLWNDSRFRIVGDVNILATTSFTSYIAFIYETYPITIFFCELSKLYSLALISGQKRSISVPIWFGKLVFHIAILAFQVWQSANEKNSYDLWLIITVEAYSKSYLLFSPLKFWWCNLPIVWVVEIFISSSLAGGGSKNHWQFW